MNDNYKRKTLSNTSSEINGLSGMRGVGQYCETDRKTERYLNALCGLDLRDGQKYRTILERVVWVSTATTLLTDTHTKGRSTLRLT